MPHENNIKYSLQQMRVLFIFQSKEFSLRQPGDYLPESQMIVLNNIIIVKILILKGLEYQTFQLVVLQK